MLLIKTHNGDRPCGTFFWELKHEGMIQTHTREFPDGIRYYFKCGCIALLMGGDRGHDSDNGD